MPSLFARKPIGELLAESEVGLKRAVGAGVLVIDHDLAFVTRISDHIVVLAEGKIIAARRLDLRVVMVRRPPPPPGPVVETVEAAVAWVTERLGSVRVVKI
jgi:energy-coupling factor transporter ATP-binding protein EcfA2